MPPDPAAYPLEDVRRLARDVAATTRQQPADLLQRPTGSTLRYWWLGQRPESGVENIWPPKPHAYTKGTSILLRDDGELLAAETTRYSVGGEYDDTNYDDHGCPIRLSHVRPASDDDLTLMDFESVATLRDDEKLNDGSTMVEYWYRPAGARAIGQGVQDLLKRLM